jgi:hypothetical protein
MEDFLPMLSVFLAVCSALLIGVFLYALSFFMPLEIAAFLVFGVFSLIFVLLIYFLAPSIDNKDATTAIRKMAILVIIADIAVVLFNLIKLVARFF